MEISGWTGNSDGWQLAIFDLSQYAGQSVMFRFRFGSDGEISGDGLLMILLLVM